MKRNIITIMLMAMLGMVSMQSCEKEKGANVTNISAAVSFLDIFWSAFLPLTVEQHKSKKTKVIK